MTQFSSAARVRRAEDRIVMTLVVGFIYAPLVLLSGAAALMSVA